MSSLRLSRLTLAIAFCTSATPAFAGAQSFNTARSLAMGGTGVAVAHPATANSANPAMLAAGHHNRADDFGLILPSVNARFADGEKTVDQVDAIQKTIDQINSAGTVSEARAGAASLQQQLRAIDRDTARADAGVGLSLAVPSPAVAVGVFTNGNLRATVQGQYDPSDDALLQTIAAGSPPPPNFGNSLKSRARVLASAVAEVGVSLAHSYPLSGAGNLQLGLSPKYVQLRTFQYTETVSGFDKNSFNSSENQTSKGGFNLDLGAAYAFGESGQWNAGIAVKNIIPMKLDSAASRPLLGEKVRTLKLDPQVTVGLAHAGQFHVITAEVQLNRNRAFGYEGDTQWLALGAEFDAFRYAQLRIGARQNLANNDGSRGIQESSQLTFGIGVSPFGVRLDLAGLVSNTDTGAAIELGAAF